MKCLALIFTAVAFAPFSNDVFAQATASAGFALKNIEGIDPIGAHFSIIATDDADLSTGFFYFSSLGRLVSAQCGATGCRSRATLSSVANNRGLFPSAILRRAADGGLPLVSYYDAATQDLILGACSVDQSCPSMNERILESAGDVGQESSIALNPSTGRAYISYYDATNQDLKLYRCSDAACGSGDSVSLQTTGNVGRRSAAVFSGSTLTIAYEDVSLNQIWYTSLSAPYASATAQNLGAGSKPQILVDASGNPQIIYTAFDGSLRLVRCAAPACLSGTTTRTLLPAGQGDSPTLKLKPDGTLAISATQTATGTVRILSCNNAICDAPIVAVIDNAPGRGGESSTQLLPDGSPLVFYHDASNQSVRFGGCGDTTCAITPFNDMALNGFSASSARLAMRTGDLPTVAYLKRDGELRPALALCNDAACNTITKRNFATPPASVAPVALNIRSDGRAILYHGDALGGTALESCSDATCSAFTRTQISASNSDTNTQYQMTLRAAADGRPVLAYVDSTNNDVYAYICSNVNCSSGAARLLGNESNTMAQILQMNILVDNTNRPVLIYAVVLNNNTYTTKYVRCNDSECITATTTNIGNVPTNFALPAAFRSDGRLAFLESSNALNYVLCSDVACSSQTRTALNVPGLIDPVYTMALSATNVPSFEISGPSNAKIASCIDATCTGGTLNTTAAINEATAFDEYVGSVALSSSARASAVFSEELRADIYLALPVVDNIFANGFE
jgi:hypothetical protein